MRISSQSKLLKFHAEKLKEKFNYALNKANDAKLAQKEGKYQVLYFQERMDKIILKLSTLERPACLNVQKRRE